jgi:beta-N-acetylhexosaminidase
LPLKNLDKTRIVSLAIGDSHPDIFSETLKLYTKTNAFYISKSESYNSFRALFPKISSYNTLIISIHATNNRPGDNYGISQQTIRFLNELNFNGRLILCLFGNPYSLALFDGLENVDAILVAYENNDDFKHLAAQGIFGAFNMNGLMPVSSDLFFQYGTTVDVPNIRRLSYGMPEEVLMNSNVLDSIGHIINEAIKQKAMPGCQVLVARHGKVVYHKGFGFHSYDGKNKVTTDDLYDLASITKIAATVPLIMKLHEEGVIDINENLGRYLPELDTTDKGNLSIVDILTHQAGLQSWIPFYYSLLQPLDTSQSLFNNSLTDDYPLKLGNNLYVNRNVKIRDGIYHERFSPEYPLQVADRIFLNRSYIDTVYHSIINSPLNNRRNYLYSDLGMYFLHRMIEEKTGQLLYPLLYNYFYSRLGATTLGYLPLNRFPIEMIVPTENDIIFRNQILQGYVHDPGAAMLGGVAGHAGLFSNANDLAKMMQMYLDDGIYGGEQYISDSTIWFFTDCTFCRNNGNRRGIGFDKPEPDPRRNGPTGRYASLSSYGHSGFTGTIAWVDPKYNLVYIFLSNRIHPDQFNQKLIQMNIRTRIQDIIYKSIMDSSLLIH